MDSYNLTNSQKGLISWFVLEVRNGALSEEFYVVWVGDEGQISKKEYKGDNLPTITRGALDALTAAKLLLCTTNYKTVTSTTGKAHPKITYREQEINRRCALTQKAYDAVDNDFATQNSGDIFQMSGDFRGAILNIKSILTNVSQSIGELPSTDQEVKTELKQLIERLNGVLQQAPPDKVEEAEAVAKTAELLIETVNQEKPNKTMVQITAEGLKKAAENIKEVLPTVLTIATQIVTAIFKLTNQ